MSVTLFGNSKTASHVAPRQPKAPKAPKEAKVKQKRQKRPLRTLAIILAILLFLECAYFFMVYTDQPTIAYWRNIYINSALSTMRHQWMATYLLPKDVVQEVIDRNTALAQQAAGKASKWEKKANERELDAEIIEVKPLTPEERAAAERKSFYEVFWEIDETSMEAYLTEHPDALSGGWTKIKINEAGLDDSGTSINTIFGEQVLAIDAQNAILLVRVRGDRYRGVLAIGKNPEQLTMEWSVGVGKFGQEVGKIAERTNGILAMTGSGFIDEDGWGNQGNGNGGILSGYAMCNGVGAQGRVSRNVSWHNFVRMEIHDDDLMYIKDINDPVSDNCREALEFEPAMIVDGEVLVNNWWVEMNPRTAIGQSDKYEFLMLAIEGRNPGAGILGTDINVCAEILKQHNCMQAINLDGGTSTIMWYDGEYVVRCSNAGLPKGRPLPNAIVYHAATKN